MGVEAPLQSPRAPLTGTELGRYLLGPRLGVGGAASVYLGLLRGPHEFERVVAVKVVHEHLSESKDFVNMFLDEANLAVRFSHPNIVHTYELGQEGSHLFLVMEYLSGQPLSKLLERIRERGEQLPHGVVAWLGARAADGLAYAHALSDESGKPVGLVHRDVSPQNVFLTYDGRVLVIDWGIARAEGRLTHTGLGRIKGKLAYMAPEQMLRQSVDHRADLFSLGATLYEALVGQRPFEAEDEAEAVAMLLEEKAPPPEDRVPGFPAELSRILLRALEREPLDRYPDASALARELDAFVASSGVAEPAEETAKILARLFEEERAEQARAVAALRDTPIRRVAFLPRGATITADPTASTIHPHTRPSLRNRMLLGAAAAMAAVAGLAIAMRPHAAAKPEPSSSAAPSMVTLEVQVEPPVDATVLIAGTRAKGVPPRAVLPERHGVVPIDVSAPGYEAMHVDATGDRDQRIVVRLVPAPSHAEKAAPEDSAARRPAAASSSGPRSPAPSRPPASAPRAAPNPGKKDSLVTDYPF